MARVSNPLIGATSGSVGGVTFSKWKGINVIKSKPTVVANPQTPAQTAQRSAFSQMVAIYRLLVAILVFGFKELAIKKSAFNAFVSSNLPSAFDFSTPGSALFKPEELKISKGTISPTPISSVSSNRSNDNVLLNWNEDLALPGMSATDKTLLCIYNAAKDEFAFSSGSFTRNLGASNIDIPSNWEIGDVLHCYLGFTNSSGDSASDSTYDTCTIV